MKKTIVILLMLLALISIEKYKAQGSNTLGLTPVSPGGFFDRVFDKDGREYSLANLQVRLDDSQNTIQVSSTTTCSAGFFNVYFANGSGMESTTIQAHNDRRALVCHILENVSGLLGGWATWPANVRVNMLVDDITNYGVTTPSTSGVLGLATSFYAIPNNPTSSNPGIAENMLQKTIKSRQDAWTNLISPVVSTGGSGFYHGAMAFNFANPSYNWFTNYSGGLAASNQLDLYTVILHEITHALGFASMISGTGVSKFGSLNNYYSTYDQFLYDKNYNPLLTSSGCSTQYGLSFTSSASYLAPGCTSVSPTNSTNCTNACLYNSSNLAWMPVYTPACFEPPSSLSHFEDMCFPNFSSPYGNDLYFTMSNANGNGTNKRYLKPEERKVFCDLGYTVSTTYTSAAVGASTVYSSSCTPPNIWGQNDGFLNGSYTYTSTGGVINFSISSGPNSILSNDASSAFTASCVQTVYNNGNLNVNTVTGVISFTPNTNYVGPILLRYIPVDANQKQGNITYIYGFVFPGNCIPASPCDLVQNGTFESRVGCGGLTATNGNTVSASCWLPYTLSPDLFVSGCSNSPMPANLGVNTYSSSFNGSFQPFTSINPSTNSVVLGLGSVSSATDIGLSESYANFLGTPLVNNQVYTLNFWAYEFVGAKTDPFAQTTSTQVVNSYSVPLVLTFASSNAYVPTSLNTYPNASITPVKSLTLASTFNVWRNYNVTFTYTPSFSSNWLYMGADRMLQYNVLSSMVPGSTNNGLIFYVLLDNISIKPIAQTAQFNLPSTTMCASQGYTDLAQYVSTPNGSFSGVGVTTTTTTPIKYNFNSPASLPNGLYTITFTYTDQIGCVQTAVQQVSLGTVNSSVNLAYLTNTTCVNGTTLSVVSPLSGLSYTWNPGSIASNSIAVSSSIQTTYTAQALAGTNCYYTGTAQVSPNVPTFSLSATSVTICPGISGLLYANGSYSTILWNPGNYTNNPYPFIPASSAVYSVVATSSLGCSLTKTVNVTVPNLPVSISSNSASICSGGNVTLTAIGSGTACSPCVTWFPGPINGNTLVVTPTTTTIYTANITNSLNCWANATIQINVTNFSISPSMVNSCAGSLATLTAVGNFTSIVWQPGGYTVSPLTVTVTPNLTYTATANFSNGCVSSQTFAFGITDVNPPNFQVVTNYPITCAGNTETLSLTSSSLSGISSQTWIPSGLTTPTISITPTTSGTYTALVTSTAGCTYWAFGALNISTACCTSTFPAIANLSQPNQTITGSKVLNGNLIIPSGTNLTLVGEILFASNVKITVSDNANINLTDAHLYACSNNMWQGIEVLDGGSLNTVRVTKDNLIEDAINAVSVVNQATTNLSNVLTISKTTFNKNYIDINISGYSRTNSTYPFNINECVFTCRDFSLPVGTTIWPQTGTTSSVNTTSADLRYVSQSTPTTGLISPYLNQGFPITNLKPPYSNQISQIAIQINSVGVTSGTAFGMTIGSTGASSFNLFDNHGRFISASNSNVTCINNAFQNTKTYTVSGGATFGGSAVYHTTSGFMNSALTLTGTSASSGNRFWDCHKGVDGNKPYLFWLENSIFRSTQNTSFYSLNSFLPGNSGVSITTNKFDYYMGNNEFTNIQNAINTQIVPATFTIVPTNSLSTNQINGVMANRFRVYLNTFSAGTGTNNYMDNAVKFSGINTAPWFVPSLTITPFAQAVSVKNNTLTNVFRGISISNNSGFQSEMAANVITLKEDNAINPGVSQHAIDLLNSMPTNTSTIGKNIITSNTVSYAASSATANIYTSLVFCGSNGYGIASPSVTCNDLSQAYQGFVFDNSNSGTVWGGNNMTLPMTRGFVLDNAGVIGTQGGSTTAISNKWIGGTWNSINSNYGTYVGNNSLAQSSLLWVKNGNTFPPSSFGSVAPGLWFNAPGSVSVSTGGDYNCSGIPNSRTVNLPNGSNYSSADQLYMARVALYRFLDANDSVRNANTTMGSFYATHNTTSIGKFTAVEKNLYINDISGAVSLNSSITPTNTVETNYKDFYARYANYASANFNSISTAYDNELFALANLCPGTNGACIYQARALYNLIKRQIYNFGDCPTSGGSRLAIFNNTIPEKQLEWNVEMFPNPANTQLTFVSRQQNEKLKIELKDLSNRVVLIMDLETNDFIANLDLKLIDGLYLVTITNSNHETISKKLIVSH